MNSNKPPWGLFREWRLICQNGFWGGGLFEREVIREWGLIRSFTNLATKIYNYIFSYRIHTNRQNLWRYRPQVLFHFVPIFGIFNGHESIACLYHFALRKSHSQFLQRSKDGDNMGLNHWS